MNKYFLFMGIVLFGLSGCFSFGGYKGEKENLPVTINQAYVKECGSCHWDYNPALLPTRSWVAMMDGLEKHFGELITLEPKLHREIRDYLMLNSAEHANAELSRKIINDTQGTTPTRIIEINYIKRRHHHVDEQTFKRKKIRSRANCTACHQSYKEGVFEEDDVKIPPAS